MKNNGTATICLGLLLAVGIRQAKAADSPQKAGRTPERYSAWYRFESGRQLGRSTGPTPLPATVWNASVAKGRFGRGVHMGGEPRNGIYLQNPAAFFGGKAVQGTISLWAKPDAVGEESQVLADFVQQRPRISHPGGRRIIIYFKGDRLSASAFGSVMSIDNPLSSGQWTHLTLTWKADIGMSLYINGKEAAEMQGEFEPVDLDSYWPGRFGCLSMRGGMPFSGTFDEVRITNYYVDGHEAAALTSVNPDEIDLDIIPAGSAAFHVVNRSEKAVTVRADIWTPAKHLPFPFMDFIPAGFNTRGWSAGPCKVAPTVSGITLGPGEATEIYPAPDFSPLTRFRARIMAGTGFAEREISPWPHGSAAIEREGLVLEILRSKPVIFYANEDFAIPCSIYNGTGKDFSGELIAEVTGKSRNAEVRQEMPLHLPQGRTVDLDILYKKQFPPGGMDLKVFAKAKGQPVLIDRRRIYFTSKVDLKNINEVAVRMTDILDLRKHIFDRDYATVSAYDELTKCLRDDDVGVIVHNGNAMKDGNSFRRDLEWWLEQGMKIWRGSAVSFKHKNIVCEDPKKFERLSEYLSELGAAMRDNPAVLAMAMAGEATNYPPCYCEHCNVPVQLAPSRK